MVEALLGKGWRGCVTRNKKTNIVTKMARHPSLASAIRKEIVILRKLNNSHIHRVPQLIDRTDHSFRYTYIPGKPVSAVRSHVSKKERSEIVYGLLQCAYGLDRHAVAHGEYGQPRTNMLWDGRRIAVVDFERGSLYNLKGRNMKQFAQRCVRQGICNTYPPKNLHTCDALYVWITQHIDL